MQQMCEVPAKLFGVDHLTFVNLDRHVHTCTYMYMYMYMSGALTTKLSLDYIIFGGLITLVGF